MQDENSVERREPSMDIKLFPFHDISKHDALIDEK